jgi:hypothetical protein
MYLVVASSKLHQIIFSKELVINLSCVSLYNCDRFTTQCIIVQVGQKCRNITSLTVSNNSHTGAQAPQLDIEYIELFINNTKMKYLDIICYGKLEDGGGMSRMLQPCLFYLLNINILFRPTSAVSLKDIVLIVVACIELETLMMVVEPLPYYYNRGFNNVKVGTISSVEYNRFIHHNKKKEFIVRGDQLCCTQMIDFFHNIGDFTTVELLGSMIVTDCLIQTLVRKNPQLINLVLLRCGNTYSLDALKILICTCKNLVYLQLWCDVKDHATSIKLKFMSLYIHRKDSFSRIKRRDFLKRLEDAKSITIGIQYESTTEPRLIAKRFKMYRCLVKK